LRTAGRATAPGVSVTRIEIVDEMLDRYEAAVEELAFVSATTQHDATRVGAIRTRLDAMEAQANLLVVVVCFRVTWACLGPISR